MFLSLKMAKNEKFEIFVCFYVIYGFLRLKTIHVPIFDPVGPVELYNFIEENMKSTFSLFQTRNKQIKNFCVPFFFFF